METLYIHREEIHNLTSPRIVVPLIMNMVSPKSVLDVGCGTGTWLKAFEEGGVKDYIGIDGHYVERDDLKIAAEKFLAIDLRKQWSLHRRFDLVISLEVAEHLPEDVADLFISALTTHGNTILFSAAIPGQGGQSHLNEQWQDYWKRKFETRGYYFHDVIRPLIWNNPNVEWWYKQNIFLVKMGIPSDPPIVNVVHPDLHVEKVQMNLKSLKSLQTGREGIRAGGQIFLNALLFKLRRLITRGES